MKSRAVIITGIICFTLIAIVAIASFAPTPAPAAKTSHSRSHSAKKSSSPSAIPSSSPKISLSTSTPKKAIATTSPAKKAVTEDDPNFNCLTQGNHRCGPLWARKSGKHINCMAMNDICVANLQGGSTWTEIPQSIDGHSPCAELLGDTTLYACADGYLTSS